MMRYGQMYRTNLNEKSNTMSSAHLNLNVRKGAITKENAANLLLNVKTKTVGAKEVWVVSKLTKEIYEHQAAECDGLCNIDHDRISNTDPNLMPCVTCPFCKQIVDAILSETTISCPNCKVTVSRSSQAKVSA